MRLEAGGGTTGGGGVGTAGAALAGGMTAAAGRSKARPATGVAMQLRAAYGAISGTCATGTEAGNCSVGITGLACKKVAHHDAYT